MISDFRWVSVPRKPLFLGAGGRRDLNLANRCRWSGSSCLPFTDLQQHLHTFLAFNLQFTLKCTVCICLYRYISWYIYIIYICIIYNLYNYVKYTACLTSYDMVHQAKNTTMPSEKPPSCPHLHRHAVLWAWPPGGPAHRQRLLLEPDGSQTIHAESWDVLGLLGLGWFIKSNVYHPNLGVVNPPKKWVCYWYTPFSGMICNDPQSWLVNGIIYYWVYHIRRVNSY